MSSALSKAAFVYEGVFKSQRVQHALWKPMAVSRGSTLRSLNVRSSTQTPFLTRRALADVSGFPADKVRVFCERVGGGFGGKQEMFVEDILALAAIKTGDLSNSNSPARSSYRDIDTPSHAGHREGWR